MKLPSSTSIKAGMRRVEQREWLLRSSAILVTLLLTLGVLSFSVPMLRQYGSDFDALHMGLAVRGLVGLVLLFAVYTIYQQIQIDRIRHQLLQREELFHRFSESAADMIAVIAPDGRRLYNSPAYARILGFSNEELERTSFFDQVHPDDRQAAEKAVKEASGGGGGRTVEYRMRRKDGSWHVFESGVSPILDAHKNVEKLVIVNRDVSERR
jgi:PAS domain S-box-containing protein